MSILENLKRGQYTLWVVKLKPQRPEHVAAKIKKYPKMYPYTFNTIHKFDKIPESFWEIYHAILRKARDVDNTVYGVYAIVLHGRGKKYGNQPEEAKYKAGCKFIFSPTKGFKFFDVKFGKKVFMDLIRSAREVNAYLVGGRRS